MKNGVIAAKHSRWTSVLDLEYLDETSEIKQEQMKEKQTAIGQKLKQFSDYASKEELGQVHVSGYFYKQIALNSDGTYSSPALLNNQERKRRINQIWLKKLAEPVYGCGARRDTIQHRIVFSMSNPMQEACLKAGVNPDKLLHTMMKKVMHKFEERFHQGDKITYAYGFHHDTDNPHVHVALCPRTEKGKYVGFSKPKYKNIKTYHKDQYGFCMDFFEKENQKWGEILSKPEKVRELLQNKYTQSIFFTHRPESIISPQVRAQQPQKVKTATVQLGRLNELQKELHSLEQEIKAERIIKAVTQIAGFGISFQPKIRIPKLLNSISKAARAARNQRVKDLREKIYLMRQDYYKSNRSNSTNQNYESNQTTPKYSQREKPTIGARIRHSL